MDQYQELLARRELIFARWMKYVEAVKLPTTGKPLEFHSAGVVFTPNGTLRITGVNSLGSRLLELEISPGETEVRETHVSRRLRLALGE